MTAEEHLTAALKLLFKQGMDDLNAGRETNEPALYATGILECLLTLMKREDAAGLQMLFKVGCELIGGKMKIEDTL